jgi:hypothetical protein
MIHFEKQNAMLRILLPNQYLNDWSKGDKMWF